MKKKFLVLGTAFLFCGMSLLSSEEVVFSSSRNVTFVCSGAGGTCAIKCDVCGDVIEAKWTSGQSSDPKGACFVCGAEKWLTNWK